VSLTCADELAAAASLSNSSNLICNTAGKRNDAFFTKDERIATQPRCHEIQVPVSYSFIFKQLACVCSFFIFYPLRYFLKNQTFNRSAVIIYTATISNIAAKFISGKGVNPISLANGRYGKPSVIDKPAMLKIKRYFPGLLLKKFLCVLMMNKINNSVRIDSINHPV